MIRLLIIIITLYTTYSYASTDILLPRIEAGYSHTIAFKSDGTLWGWGLNSYGQVGDNTKVDKVTPAKITTSNLWQLLASGETHNAAIDYDGYMYVWGGNTYGQLGTGNTTNLLAPSQLNSNTWKHVSAGGHFTMGIRSDLTLWTWGRNDYGQLGDNTLVKKYSPVQIGSNSWKTISAGHFHSLGVSTDGKLWAWGLNSYGQLGDNSTADKKIPTLISSDNWIAVSAGKTHSLAIRDDKTLWGWGRNESGQLGDGTNIDNSTIHKIGSDSDWLAVSAGDSFNIALKADGSIWSWGRNTYGQLGDGTKVNKNSPIQIGDNKTEWLAVSAGENHAAVLKLDGIVWTFGRNNYGQLGNGTKTDNSSAVEIVFDKPDQFDFTDQTNVDVNSWIESNEIIVTGISHPSYLVTMKFLDNTTEYYYRLNDGDWLRGNTTLKNGDKVRLKLKSSSNYSYKTSIKIVIGDVTDTFSITTSAKDIYPDIFYFDPITDAPLNTLTESNAITITGINAPLNVSVTTSGEFIIGDNGTWSKTSSTITSGQTIKVRQTSSSSYSTKTRISLTIGTTTANFDITTTSADNTPDSFSFQDVTGTELGILVESDNVTISGLNTNAAISISKGGEYQINGGTWTTGSSTVKNGDIVRVRQKSSYNYGTKTDITLTVGTYSDIFSVTTIVAPDNAVPSQSTPVKYNDGDTAQLFKTITKVASEKYILIQPSLSIPSEDQGKKASVFMYIYVPDLYISYNLDGGTTTLTSTLNYTILKDRIKLTEIKGHTFEIYYGYILEDGTIKYYSYRLLVPELNAAPISPITLKNINYYSSNDILEKITIAPNTNGVIHPTLSISTTDIGKEAIPLLLISFSNGNQSIFIQGESTILSSTLYIDLLDYMINFNQYNGYHMKVYAGYQIVDEKTMYGGYELIVGE